MSRYTRSTQVIKETHRVRQLGSVWLWTGARRIHVKDILEFADGLREADAPPDSPVQFDENCLHREAMNVEWSTP